MEVDGQKPVIYVFKPHVFVVRSPRLRLLTLFTPGGLEEAFRKVGSPAYLDLPSEAITYSMVELEQTARRFSEYGATFLTPDQIRDQLPLYPKPAFTDSRQVAKQQKLG